MCSTQNFPSEDINQRYEKLRKRIRRKFPKLQEIEDYLILSAQIYPCNVRLERIGSSCEGRPVQMAILQADQKCPKDAVMIESGIHAREWITHTTALYLIDFLLTKRSLLKRMDFYIIPCLNPDGYAYTHTCNRLWRKNLNRNGSSNPQKWGVDLNRNFPFGYGLAGSSSERASYRYRGEGSLSEPESESLANAIDKYARHIRLYISIHCFGNLIMYPWSYTFDVLPDVKDLHNCAHTAQKAMKKAFPDSKFQIGQLSKAMYVSSGTTTDYVRGVHGIKFCFTMELHKGGKSGFTPKSTKILRVARETTLGIEAMVKFVHRFYTKRRDNPFFQPTKL